MTEKKINLDYFLSKATCKHNLYISLKVPYISATLMVSFLIIWFLFKQRLKLNLIQYEMLSFSKHHDRLFISFFPVLNPVLNNWFLNSFILEQCFQIKSINKDIIFHFHFSFVCKQQTKIVIHLALVAHNPLLLWELLWSLFSIKMLGRYSICVYAKYLIP